MVKGSGSSVMLCHAISWNAVGAPLLLEDKVDSKEYTIMKSDYVCPLLRYLYSDGLAFSNVIMNQLAKINHRHPSH